MVVIVFGLGVRVGWTLLGLSFYLMDNEMDDEELWLVGARVGTLPSGVTYCSGWCEQI